MIQGHRIDFHGLFLLGSDYSYINDFGGKFGFKLLWCILYRLDRKVAKWGKYRFVNGSLIGRFRA